MPINPPLQKTPALLSTRLTTPSGFSGGIVHLLLGRSAEAFECTSKSISMYPVDVSYYIFVSACGHLGRTEDAKTAITKLLSLAPGAAISNFATRMPFRDQRHLDILLDGLRKAGLPE